jgi:hypothetical protein
VQQALQRFDHRGVIVDDIDEWGSARQTIVPSRSASKRLAGTERYPVEMLCGGSAETNTIRDLCRVDSSVKKGHSILATLLSLK